MKRLLVVALGVMLLGAAPAPVPTTETFTSADTPVGTAFDWTVPEGVTSVTITATGGNGGASKAERIGGRGAVVTVVLAVTPGQVLSITLGADGGGTGQGGAGFGAGGSGISAGGGGGSTAISVDGTVSIVAGGGGGSSSSTAAGGGGAGGTPIGVAGSRRGGAAGGNGAGGLGIAPWGGPGGTGFLGSGGTVNGSEAGAGGGAGYGGGGAGGASGDGGGGGSYSESAATTTYASRLDDLVDGWVQLDYLLPAIEPTQAPTAPDDTNTTYDPQTIFGVSYTAIGIGAAVFVALGVGLLILRRRQK